MRLTRPTSKSGGEAFRKMSNALVRKLSLYARLNAEEIRLLVDASRPVQPFRGLRDIVRRGSRPTGMVILLEGWACRYRVLADGGRQITAFLMPGDFLDFRGGQSEAFEQGVGALTDCQVSQLFARESGALVHATPSLTSAFLQAQLAEADILREWIVSLGQRMSLARFTHLMLEICTRMQMINDSHVTECELPFTQQVMADALGFTSVHVNRVLRKLRENGIMTIQNKRLLIKDMDRAIYLAEFSDHYLKARTVR